MRIPFTKAHGVGNDFLLTWSKDVSMEDLPGAARSICDRHAGIGADGWILITPTPEDTSAVDGAIRLFNSDGSEAELSGNGTRCAAAVLVDAGLAGENVRIRTGAGVKHLVLIERDGLWFRFEMNMGRAAVSPEHLRFALPLRDGPREVTVLDVGNPQCAVFVGDLGLDWPALGAEIEGHPYFPHRTNVSFIRVMDEHTLEVRFFERGAGVTQSSGTGSTGAMAAAILRGLVSSPVRVMTPAGPLDLRMEGDLFLAGPAEIVASGDFHWRREAVS